MVDNEDSGRYMTYLLLYSPTGRMPTLDERCWMRTLVGCLSSVEHPGWCGHRYYRSFHPAPHWWASREICFWGHLRASYPSPSFGCRATFGTYSKQLIACFNHFNDQVRLNLLTYRSKASSNYPWARQFHRELWLSQLCENLIQSWEKQTLERHQLH
jgi:hypothetical protein